MRASLARPSPRCSRNKHYVAYPMPLAPLQPIAFVFTVERSRAAPEHCGVDVVEGVHTDYRIHAASNLAGDEWHDAAIHADMELRGPGPEFVWGDALGAHHSDAQAARPAGGPHAPMFDAERTPAGASGNLSGRRLPVQSEAQVPAVAASRDEHVECVASRASVAGARHRCRACKDVPPAASRLEAHHRAGSLSAPWALREV